MDREIARIRLIGHDTSLLLSINEILTRAAFDVSVSLDAKDALSFLTQDPPDLVIIDHQGHDGDALEALRRIKEHSPGIPVIMLSSRTDWAFYEEFQRLGGELLHPRKMLRPLYVLHAVDRVLQGASPKGRQPEG